MRRLCPLFLFAFTILAEPPNGVWIVSHRGFKAVAPENSIAAFEAAANAGADYMELDVRPTSDGQLILMHDATVNRTTNGQGPVTTFPFDAIRKLDAGNGQPVATFREALLWAKGRGVRIDVDHKDGPIDAIAATIRETGMIRHVVIEGPRERLQRVVQLLPGVDTMPKVTSPEDARSVCAALHTTIVRLSLAQLAQPEYPAAVKACGARVSVTLLGATDNEAEMRRAIQLGARLLETDHPDLAAKARAAVQ